MLNSYSQADEIREYDKCPDDKYCRKHRGDSEEKILSRLVIPSIGDIDDGLRPERMCSSMLESTAGLRLAEDWRRNLDDRSV